MDGKAIRLQFIIPATEHDDKDVMMFTLWLNFISTCRLRFSLSWQWLSHWQIKWTIRTDSLGNRPCPEYIFCLAAAADLICHSPIDMPRPAWPFTNILKHVVATSADTGWRRPVGLYPAWSPWQCPYTWEKLQMSSIYAATHTEFYQ